MLMHLLCIMFDCITLSLLFCHFFFFFLLSVLFFFVFFFSSRRRHTRSLCDWSSDVCSSDLVVAVRANQELDILNKDETTHNLHPLPLNNREWNKAQAPGTSVDARFAREEVDRKSVV